MFRFWQNRSVESAPLLLTPKIVYDLANECSSFAEELARHDPLQVHLPSCHRYNAWLPSLRRYEKFAKQVALRAARPIARWQLLTLGAVVWLILGLALPGRLERFTANAILSGWMMGLIVLYFIPQRFYGTTVELLEGQLLLIVEMLQQLLQAGDINFSEAAFFRAKETLDATQRELRQQIDLAHRNDRSYL